MPQLLCAASLCIVFILNDFERGVVPMAPTILRLQIASVITYQWDLNLSPWSRAPLTWLTIRYQWKCNERARRLVCNAMHFQHSYYEWRSFTPLRIAGVCLFSAWLLAMYNQCSLLRNVYVIFTRVNTRNLSNWFYI